MNEFLSYLTGGLEPPFFAALFFMAFVGVALKLLIEVATRNPLKDGSPIEFSWAFLIQTKWARVSASIISIYLSIRFIDKIFSVDVTGNRELYLFLAVLVGLGYDLLFGFIEKQMTRLKSRE